MQNGIPYIDKHFDINQRLTGMGKLVTYKLLKYIAGTGLTQKRDFPIRMIK